MESLVARQIAEAPEHTVLPSASKYDLRSLTLSWENNSDGAVIEMAVSTHTDYIVLRFKGVEEIYIPGGDLIASVSLKIQDTSQCPSTSQHIPPVRVGGVEHSENVLQFWAQSVERVSQT